MTRTLRIISLRWQAWWVEFSLEIDEAQVAIHTPSLERNLKRLATLRAELDRLYSPASLISRALRRK